MTEREDDSDPEAMDDTRIIALRIAKKLDRVEGAASQVKAAWLTNHGPGTIVPGRAAGYLDDDGK